MINWSQKPDISSRWDWCFYTGVGLKWSTGGTAFGLQNSFWAHRLVSSDSNAQNHKLRIVQIKEWFTLENRQTEHCRFPNLLSDHLSYNNFIFSLWKKELKLPAIRFSKSTSSSASYKIKWKENIIAVYNHIVPITVLWVQQECYWIQQSKRLYRP